MDNNDDKTTNDTGDNTQSQAIPPEKAAEAMKAFGEMMEGLGAKKREGAGKSSSTPDNTIKVDPAQAGPLPEMMLNLFATAIQQARENQSTSPAPSNTGGQAKENVVNLDEERVKRAPREPTELEQKIQSSLKSTFEGYVEEKVAADAKPGQEISVDGEFLKEHGPALMGALLSSFTKSVLPEDNTIRIPVKKGEGGEDPVTLKVDLQEIFNKIKTPPSSKD